MYDADEDLIAETRRMVAEAKICQPGLGQRVERCHWSRTGWAVVESDGRCTCQPAEAPIETDCKGKHER